MTAFNPYNGVGLPAGVSAQPGMTVAPPQAYPAVEAAPPAQGMAFNPWRSANAGSAVVTAGTANVVAAYAPGLPPPAFVPGAASAYGGIGSGLPPPPPGAIQSRVIAVPERGDRPGARRAMARPPTPPVTVTATEPARALAPEPAPPPARRAEAMLTRVSAPAPAPAAAPSPPPPPPAPAAAAPPPPPPAPPPAARPAPPIEVSRLPPATAPARVVTSAPPPPAPEPPNPPPPIATPAMTVSFQPQSAEINDAARAALDAMAKSFAQRGVKQVELRAYAGGSDPGDARKVALARALSVRSYLIDQGVKARIEVGAFAAATRGTGSERVDVMTP